MLELPPGGEFDNIPWFCSPQRFYAGVADCVSTAYTTGFVTSCGLLVFVLTYCGEFVLIIQKDHLANRQSWLGYVTLLLRLFTHPVLAILFNCLNAPSTCCLPE